MNQIAQLRRRADFLRLATTRGCGIRLPDVPVAWHGAESVGETRARDASLVVIGSRETRRGHRATTNDGRAHHVDRHARMFDEKILHVGRFDDVRSRRRFGATKAFGRRDDPAVVFLVV